MTIGFHPQKKYFSRLLKAGELSHAYLFVGPEAIGKKSFALEISADNDRARHDTAFIAPDQEKAFGTISIDQVRELKSFLSTTPVFGRYKLVIVDDAHRVTEDAANALLKSIEEPYRSLVWILVTHQPDVLPTTVRSRCQAVRFLPQGDTAVAELPEVKKLFARDREMLVALAQGRVGWALRAIAENRMADIRDALALFEKLPTMSVLDRLTYAKTLIQEEQATDVVSWWLAWSRIQLPTKVTAARKLLARLPTLQQSQFNHRLALENFLLGL